MGPEDAPKGAGFYFGPGIDAFMSGCVARDNAGHGVYVAAGAKAAITQTEASGNGQDGFHFAGTQQEVAALIEKMPEEARAPWMQMLQDAVSGATGGLTVEAIKPLVLAALAAMGLTS